MAVDQDVLILLLVLLAIVAAALTTRYIVPIFEGRKANDAALFKNLLNESMLHVLGPQDARSTDTISFSDKKTRRDKDIKKDNELARLESENQRLHALLADRDASLAGKDKELREAAKSLKNFKKKASKRDAKQKEYHSELNAQLDDANKKVNALEAAVVDLDAELRLQECKLKCSICTNNEVNTVFHCGHTSCGGCIENWMLRSNQCPVCKKKIGYLKRLFLGS